MAATAGTMTALDFERWLCHAEGGEQVVYHRGYIGADRQEPTPQGRRVAALADYAYEHSTLDIPIISPCAHIRGYQRGSGFVTLTQQRATGGVTLYIARRRD